MPPATFYAHPHLSARHDRTGWAAWLLRDGHVEFAAGCASTAPEDASDDLAHAAAIAQGLNALCSRRVVGHGDRMTIQSPCISILSMIRAEIPGVRDQPHPSSSRRTLIAVRRPPSSISEHLSLLRDIRASFALRLSVAHVVLDRMGTGRQGSIRTCATTARALSEARAGTRRSPPMHHLRGDPG